MRPSAFDLMIEVDFYLARRPLIDWFVFMVLVIRHHADPSRHPGNWNFGNKTNKSRFQLEMAIKQVQILPKEHRKRRFLKPVQVVCACAQNQSTRQNMNTTGIINIV